MAEMGCCAAHRKPLVCCLGAVERQTVQRLWVLHFADMNWRGRIVHLKAGSHEAGSRVRTRADRPCEKRSSA